MFPPKLIEEIKSHPLYDSTADAFRRGDFKLANDMLKKLCLTSDPIKAAKEYYQTNKDTFEKSIERLGIVIINKDQPIPEPYIRNTFSEKTCITTQKLNPPEWKDITANIIYEDKQVYEDHYPFKTSTENNVYTIKSLHTKPFIGEIVSNSEAKHTVDKFKKNSLYLIISTLHITLSSKYSVLDILDKLTDIKSLTEVVVNHNEKQYTQDELDDLTSFFRKTKWSSLIITKQLILKN